MEYYNVAELEAPGDDQSILEGKLVSLDQRQYNTRFLCSTDTLLDQKRNQPENWCEQLAEERQNNSSWRLVFADFSFCSSKPSEIKTLTSDSTTLIPSAVKSTEINVLLLGETGVGKSTFINAFVNYLAFDTLEQARTGKPIALMPVSFLMTINDEFEEFSVIFGEPNPNENNDNPGQSVTEHCESYTFDIGHDIKLRIIDTPGIGDTCGLAQDDKNIQHILSYINNQSHLNAICILLKPNASRLNAFFRSCFLQIVDFLGSEARKNILFCFTNSRATFYAPGNTAPLLRKMLQELPVDHAPPFDKVNTFCFDSESFRYLAAINASDKILFDEHQKFECEQSWKKSVAESIRLLNFIQSCPSYSMNQWQSIKHAQITILSLIRPMLETMRNVLRNIVLRENSSTTTSIELIAQPVSPLASVCMTCACNATEELNHLCIMPDSTHQCQISGGCDNCNCPSSEHLSVRYKLSYKRGEIQTSRFHTSQKNTRDRLLDASIEFTYFLLHVARISENPVLPWVDWFILAESTICSRTPSNPLNQQLLKELNRWKKEYEKQLNQMTPNQEQYKLNRIYQYIEEVQRYPTVGEQMHAIRQSELQMMEKHEHPVPSQRLGTDSNVLLRRSVNIKY